MREIRNADTDQREPNWDGTRTSRPSDEAGSDPGPGVELRGFSIDEEPLVRLDPAVVLVWRIENLISMLILFVPIFGGTLTLALFRGFPWALSSFLWLVFGSLACFHSYWWPPFKYRSWSYRSVRGLIELRHGVLWQKSVLIPLSRVQHIDLSQGPLERRFGLTSIELHTAGTQQASHKISGLRQEVGVALRLRLIGEADLETDEHA